MKIPKQAIKNIVKECIMEVFTDPKFVNEMARKMAKNQPRIKQKVSIKETPTFSSLLKNKKRKIIQQHKPSKKYTGNSLLDSIISEAKGNDATLEYMNPSNNFQSQTTKVPRDGQVGNVKMNVVENTDYSMFLENEPDPDSLGLETKVKTSGIVNNIERMK